MPVSRCKIASQVIAVNPKIGYGLNLVRDEARPLFQPVVLLGGRGVGGAIAVLAIKKEFAGTGYGGSQFNVHCRDDSLLLCKLVLYH
jgi:hypothetical protein